MASKWVLGGKCGCITCRYGVERIPPPGDRWQAFQRKWTAPRKAGGKRKK